MRYVAPALFVSDFAAEMPVSDRRWLNVRVTLCYRAEDPGPGPVGEVVAALVKARLMPVSVPYRVNQVWWLFDVVRPLEGWQVKASCRAHTALFMVGDDRRLAVEVRERQKGICGICPVRATCLAQALREQVCLYGADQFGYRGGLNVFERNKIAKWWRGASEVFEARPVACAGLLGAMPGGGVLEEGAGAGGSGSGLGGEGCAVAAGG